MRAEIADAVANYWAELFQVDDKRDQLRDALRKRIIGVADDSAEGRHGFACGVDYDPQGPLLDAVNDIGIACRGCMFSADGLFPRKHRMVVRPDEVRVCEGYGAPDRTIWRDESAVSK
jgi:hypothetical protein